MAVTAPPSPRRVINVPVYWVLVAVFVVFGSPIISIYASVKIAESNQAEALAASQQAQAAARVEAIRVTCAFLASSMDVYKETPPSTKAGEAQYANYADLYRITGCQPPRTR